MKTTVFSIMLLTLLFAFQPPAGAGAAEMTFSGTIDGNVAGVGAIKGPLSFRIEGDKVTGAFSGTSSTGDAFRGTIVGAYDEASHALDANYSGTFDRVLGSKKYDTITVSGPFKGTGDVAKMKGSWGGRAKGTWSATSIGAPPEPAEGKKEEEAVCIDYGAEHKKFMTKYGLPMTSNPMATMNDIIKKMKKLEKELAAMEQAQKGKVSESQTGDDQTPKELKALLEKQKKFQDMFLLITKIMYQEHQCKMSAIKMIQ